MHETPSDAPGSNGCPHPPLTPLPPTHSPALLSPPCLPLAHTTSRRHHQRGARSRPIPASSGGSQHTTVTPSLHTFLPLGQIGRARPQAAKHNPAQRLGLWPACRRRGSDDSDLTHRCRTDDQALGTWLPAEPRERRIRPREAAGVRHRLRSLPVLLLLVVLLRALDSLPSQAATRGGLDPSPGSSLTLDPSPGSSVTRRRVLDMMELLAFVWVYTAVPKLLGLPSLHPLHQSSSINGQCTHKLYGTITIVIQQNSLLNFFALPCCLTAIFMVWMCIRDGGLLDVDCESMP